MHKITEGDKVRWKKSRASRGTAYARGVVMEVQGDVTLVGRPDLDAGDTIRWRIPTDKLEKLPATAYLH